MNYQTYNIFKTRTVVWSYLELCNVFTAIKCIYSESTSPYQLFFNLISYFRAFCILRPIVGDCLRNLFSELLAAADVKYINLIEHVFAHFCLVKSQKVTGDGLCLNSFSCNSISIMLQITLYHNIFVISGSPYRIIQNYVCGY